MEGSIHESMRPVRNSEDYLRRLFGGVRATRVAKKCRSGHEAKGRKKLDITVHDKGKKREQRS